MFLWYVNEKLNLLFFNDKFWFKLLNSVFFFINEFILFLILNIIWKIGFCDMFFLICNVLISCLNGKFWFVWEIVILWVIFDKRFVNLILLLNVVLIVKLLIKKFIIFLVFWICCFVMGVFMIILFWLLYVDNSKINVLSVM